MYQKSRKMQCSKPRAMTWLADFQEGAVEYRSTGVPEWWSGGMLQQLGFGRSEIVASGTPMKHAFALAE
jgi:hypothetical protein